MKAVTVYKRWSLSAPYIFLSPMYFTIFLYRECVSGNTLRSQLEMLAIPPDAFQAGTILTYSIQKVNNQTAFYNLFQHYKIQ